MGDNSSTDGLPDGETAIEEYILVRGDNSGNDVLRQVLNLKHAIDERFETDTLSSTDWAVDAGEGTEGQREILVGVTNREESIAANEELAGTHGYVIRSSGGKIVITASTTGLLKEAVSFFTEEYVNGSRDGVLPASINVHRKAELPLCVMSEPASMQLFVSEKASFALSSAVSDFADRMGEVSGIVPEVVKDPGLVGTKVVVSFKNALTAEQKEKPAGLPEAVGGESFSMIREKDKITLQGESDQQTVAALASLYEQLSAEVDRTLDGRSVFYYEREGVYKESWSGLSFRVVGARYLGTESVASNGRCSYYEGVSLNAYCEWKVLMADESRGSFIMQGGTANAPIFVSEDGKIEISAFYDSDSRTLTVVEKS